MKNCNNLFAKLLFHPFYLHLLSSSFFILSSVKNFHSLVKFIWTLFWKALGKSLVGVMVENFDWVSENVTWNLNLLHIFKRSEGFSRSRSWEICYIHRKILQFTQYKKFKKNIPGGQIHPTPIFLKTKCH